MYAASFLFGRLRGSTGSTNSIILRKDFIMQGQFSRTELVLGRAAMDKLAASTVAVFGIGGVGSFVAEGLARSGIGHLVLIDHDVISESNINRQLHATTKTVGLKKTEVMKQRIMDINPEAVVDMIEEFYLPDKAEHFFREHYDYVVDAIDTITGKIDIASQTKQMGIPVISSMGAGNKLDPTRFEVADIYETSVCPIARVMRKKLKERGIQALKVVYSKEVPQKCNVQESGEVPAPGRNSVPGSVSFVPSVVGLIIAGEVVKDLIREVTA